MLLIVLLISVFGVLMRAMTKSWSWYKKTLLAYLTLIGLVFAFGWLDNNARSIALGIQAVNFFALIATVYGGCLVVACTAIWLLVRSLCRKAQPVPNSLATAIDTKEVQ